MPQPPVRPRSSARRASAGSAVRSTALFGAVLALNATACGGDDPGTAVPTPPTVGSAAPEPTTSTTIEAPTTSVRTTTIAPTSSAPAPTTAEPPPAGFPFTGDSVSITSQYFEEPFEMQVAATADGLRAYDGVSDDGSLRVRCVAITRSGASTWNEWCGEVDRPATFLVLDEIDPWLVEVGAELGVVSFLQQPSSWALVSNGCTEPLVSIVTSAELGPSTATGLTCAGTEAVLTQSQVFLQPGPADGGYALLSNGDEGWNLVSRGTSLDCAGYPDAIDRCALFDVEGELPGGLPIPPSALLGPQSDFVLVRDATDEIQAMVGAATDVDAITEAIVAGLAPETDEVSAIVTSAVGGWGVDAVAVETPYLDDSTRAGVHVVWILQPFDGQPAAVVRAFAWNLCARGLAEADLCL